MSDSTKIQWAEHTGGPYLGCSCVSPGCTNCYAMSLALTRLEPIFRKAYLKAGFENWQTRPVWGDKATRVLSNGFWNDAKRINAQHAKAGTRGRWFPSMIDWLDTMPAGIIDQDGNNLNPIAVLADFLSLIADTPNLDWLLLTKRPELAIKRINEATQCVNYRGEGRLWNLAGCVPHNVWIGVSAEDQQRADERIPELLKIPAKVRFLSVEPLLGPVRLEVLRRSEHWPKPEISWVIVGGESGPGARPCHLDWVRSIVNQCRDTGVPVFVKQLGADPRHDYDGEMVAISGPITGSATIRINNGPLKLKDPKGGDMSEWPTDLQIRQFPSPP